MPCWPVGGVGPDGDPVPPQGPTRAERDSVRHWDACLSHSGRPFHPLDGHDRRDQQHRVGGTWRGGALVHARPVGMQEGRDAGQLPQRLTVEGPRDPALRARPDPGEAGTAPMRTRACAPSRTFVPDRTWEQPTRPSTDEGQAARSSHAVDVTRPARGTEPRTRCHVDGARKHCAPWEASPGHGCEEAAGP